MPKCNGQLCCVLLLLVATGCDQGSATWNDTSPNQGKENVGSIPDPSAVPVAKSDKEGSLSVLFIGNSHSAPIPGLLTSIFKSRSPEVVTNFKLAPGTSFLVTRMEQKATTDLIRSGEWDYVVLQAQKYSTSGKYKYSTEGALTLAAMAQDSGAKVMMYPEWSRRGVPDEYKRIRAIHDGIAEETGAVVAPIGEAWQFAANKTDAELYHSDGNHASELGSYLNACTFYSLLTGKSPVLDSALPNEQQDDCRLLEQAAWEAAKETFVK